MDTDDERAVSGLLERARQTASALGLDIAGTCSRECRFGPVDLLLHTVQGDVYAKATATETFYLTVWDSELVAWGQAPGLVAVVELLHRWNGHASPTELKAVFPWIITAADTSEEAVIDAQWKWMFAVDHQPLVSVARAVYAQPALRDHYPYASHGAFALLTGPVTRSTHAITFYRIAGGGWSVVGRDVDIFAPTIDHAVEQATHSVIERWPRRGD